MTHISRRTFLQSTLAMAGAATLARCGPATISTEPLVIKTAGWPLGAMPTPEEAAADPVVGAYGDALQTWLNRNPNVRIERIEANIWDPQAMLTAVAGGTAPTYFLSTVLGNWDAGRAQSAFAQGLMADMTDAIDNTGLNNSLIAPMQSAYDRVGLVNDKRFFLPIDVAMPDTIWYRRDWVAETGLAMPSADWTWDDFFQLANTMTNSDRKGLGAAWNFAGNYLDAHGFSLLSNVPAPDEGWHWRQDMSDPRWAALMQTYREHIFANDAVYSDASFTNDRPYADAFRAGAIGMMGTNILGAFGAAATDTSVAALAREQGKAFDEVVGFAPFPSGDGYRIGGINMSGGVALPPDASPELINVATDLVNYIFFGEAADWVKTAAYEASGDLQAVYTNPLPIDGKYQYDGVPGSFADAWGQPVVDQVSAIAGLPTRRAREVNFYLPAEENPGPGNQAFEDLWSQMTYVQDVSDVSAEFQNAADIWNQQAASFNSSIDRETFLAGVSQFYADTDTLLAQKMPQFHAERYTEWFDRVIRPKLS